MKKSSVENQNSNLPSEEKSSNSSQIETLSQQTKQLSITSDLPQVSSLPNLNKDSLKFSNFYHLNLHTN